MLCVDQHLITLVNSSLAELTPAVLPSSVTEEDVQQSVVSATADLAPSTSDTSSTASAVTDHGGDKQLAVPPDTSIHTAETVANDTLPNLSENFFCKRLPVPKRQRSAAKSGRAHLVSFALTSSAHLDDVEAKEAKRSKQKAAPKKMPKLNVPSKAVGGHNKQTNKLQNRGAENSKQKNQANQDYCARCKARYGDPADPKKCDDWIACGQCGGFFPRKL